MLDDDDDEHRRARLLSDAWEAVDARVVEPWYVRLGLSSIGARLEGRDTDR